MMHHNISCSSFLTFLVNAGNSRNSHQSVISDHPIQLLLKFRPTHYVVQKPPRLNTSITSICHNRKHHGQYINHINQSYQKPSVSIHQSHQSVISETTSFNTSIASVSHIRN